MYRLIILLNPLLVTFALNAQVDYLKYPSYDSIINKFFNEYSIKNIPNSDRVNFEKRPTGWHITVTEDLSNPKTIKDELFWNRKNNEFAKVNFDALKGYGENEELINEYQERDFLGYYNICPYYGYPNWDWDLIQDFKDAKNLPDSTLYALGRAYSSYATNLLYDNNGWTDGKHQFDLPNARNCMTKEQLDKYRYFRHQAIDKFNEVNELNPNYETIVGSIGVKTANEYLTSFLDLRIYQNEQEAMKEIPDGLYSDFLISVAKNYLNTCATNAILFTNGDNDTFPLLYVQAKYGFRTDVLVVNLSLLNTDRYINSLREQILDAQGLPISLTPNEIRDDKRTVIIVENLAENPLELRELIDFIKNDEHSKSYGPSNYFYVPTNRFRFRHNENNIEWEINRNYILLNQLIFLDILETDNLKRPIYFSNAMSEDSYFGSQDYLQLEGMAYRLTPTRKATNDERLGTVNSLIMYSNLMTNFDWSGLNSMISHEKLICVNYRNSFSRLAETLILEHKLDSAKLVLDKCIEVIPNELFKFDHLLIPIIESYYKINEHEQGNRIAKVLISNLRENFSSSAEFTKVHIEDKKQLSIKRLKALASEYSQQEILDLLDQ